MRFVIVTGMSGAGKRTALKMLEDQGYFCVDNLPIQLIEMFAKLTIEEAAEITKVALGVDVRSGDKLLELEEILKRLSENQYRYEILFLEADDKTLLRRYKESRRNHPLAGSDRIEKGIEKERKLLSYLKEHADYLIDTSELLTRDLNDTLNHLFLDHTAIQNLIVNIVSFGYKNGLPGDADLVFDVRFLPNPYYQEGLKTKTGYDREVVEYIERAPEYEEFLQKLTDMLLYLIPHYVSEGKTRLVIAIGCTGGQHRSVAVAREVYERLKLQDFSISIEHRDIGRG